MSFKHIITAIVFFVALSVSSSVYSQTNYSDIKVDDLTDAQIRQMIQRAEAVGYNDAQLEQMATAQGMKTTEVEKLRARVGKIRGGGGTATSADEVSSNEEVLQRQIDTTSSRRTTTSRTCRPAAISAAATGALRWITCSSRTRPT